MIEKMQKLTLLIFHGIKEDFLTRLQDLGIVHLETDTMVQDEEINQIKSKIQALKKVENQLSKIKIDRSQEVYSGDVFQLLEEYDREKEQLNDYQTKIDGLKKELLQLTPWGIFNPENIEQLEKNSIYLKFFSTSQANFEKMAKDFAYEVISTEKNKVYFAVVYEGENNWKQEIEAVEEKIPYKNRQSIEKEIADLEALFLEQQDKLNGFYRFLEQIKDNIVQYEDQLAYLLANISLSSEVDGRVLVITGWAPLKSISKVEEFLKDKDVAYLINEPYELPELYEAAYFDKKVLGKLSPGAKSRLLNFYSKDQAKEQYRLKSNLTSNEKSQAWDLLESAGVNKDDVPIKLKNGPFSRLFEPISKIYSLPDYTEIDPTPFFAPFFMAFFGLCFADLGYGLVLLLLSVVLLFVLKDKNIKKFLYLGLFFGISTIICGSILDTFFGTNITNFAFIPSGLKQLIVFPVAAGTNGPMLFSILLGIIQVFLGLMLQTYTNIKNRGLQSGLQYIGTALILIGASFYLIVNMGGKNLMVGPKILLGEWLYSIPNPKLFFTTVFFIGIGLVLLFNNPDKKIYIRPLTFLWEIYNIASGLLGDILSYIRLFALGLAGGLLGGAFNQIAFMARDGLPVGVNILAMLLILVFGHTLNFGLAALGAFVHPLRLTFVEFYKAVGFSGGGKAYTPFSNRKIEKNK